MDAAGAGLGLRTPRCAGVILVRCWRLFLGKIHVCIGERGKALRDAYRMKSLFFAACLLLLSTFGVRADSFTLDWFTLDGGGGISTGGVYSIAGTIGQPDAGPVMTGGGFSVTGGFWALPVVVQTPGAPLLTVIHFGQGQARIAWTPATPGFVLQESLSLSPANWVNSPSGASNPVTVPASLPAKFYRLHKP